jgi:hypothetical protein
MSADSEQPIRLAPPPPHRTNPNSITNTIRITTITITTITITVLQVPLLPQSRQPAAVTCRGSRPNAARSHP